MAATDNKAAFSEALDLFRIVQTDDEGPGEPGDELGVGVSFPNSGVYVDWNVDAWPDDEQLDGPHVSEYDTIEDAATVAEGEVEHLPTAAEAPTDQAGEKLERCVASVLEDNPDMSESEAYAICNDQLDGKADTTVSFGNPGGDPFREEETLDSFVEDLRSAGAEVVLIGDEPHGDHSGIHDRPVRAVGIGLEAAESVWNDYQDEAAALAGPRAVDGGTSTKADVEQKGAFSEGDAVRWTWQDDSVHGRVAEERPNQATVSGNTITGDEGEPVYIIDEWDDRVGAYRRENVAKPESSLSESNKDLPPRSEGNYVNSEAWESLTTTVAASDFTAAELDHMALEMDDVLLRARANEWIVPDAEPVVYRYDIPDEYLTDREESFFVPNAGMADAAMQVREWADEHDEFDAGAGDGELLRRADQIIEHHERGEPLAIEYWEEIHAFHERHHAQGNHELDAEYEDKPWLDDGYASHKGWGGDAGFEQAQAVMEHVESVDQEAAVEMRGAVATEQSLDPNTITEADSNRVDLDALEGELREAVEADDFYIYGKASIEQWDDDHPPTYIQMEALEGALGRYFESDTAPGIISRHHQDIPVGVPVREFEFEEDTTLEIGGETYAFEAGDTARSHVEDADGDGRPELWLAANISNDNEMGKKTRVLAAQGDLNGFSVTVHRNEDELTQEGRIVTDCDLHAVTIGTGEQIKNPGSEFDVASFKGPVERVKSVVRGLLS